MPALRNNILANYAGQLWMALMAVAFVPLYIRALGMEAYGLIGLMLSMQALSLLLDLGMGGVLNRELARRAHIPATAQTMPDLVRTFEWLLWPLSLLLALSIWIASRPLAQLWLNPVHLTRAETAHAIAIMGLAVALQWPSSFYSSGLSGLERQPLLNLINAGFATLRSAGVLGVLWWVSPTINAFFWWFAAVGACQSLVSAAFLWKLMPASGARRARFRSNEVRAAGRFAGGLVAITGLSVAVTQLDRIVLSAMRPLVELGYFSLGISVAAGMGRMILPMFNALYPRYSKLVSLGDDVALIKLYHASNQCLAVVVGAVSAVLIVFARDVLYLWTGDVDVADKVALPLSILVAGTALNGMMNLPYALQLANGWTSLTIKANILALLFGVPFCILAVEHFGMTGAALLWLVINFGYVAIAVPLMHRRLLPREMGIWYVRDMLPPMLAAASVALVAGWMLPALPRTLPGAATLLVVSGLTMLAAAFATPATRELMRQRLPRRCIER